MKTNVHGEFQDTLQLTNDKFVPDKKWLRLEVEILPIRTTV
jgi:hypothetical protein